LTDNYHVATADQRFAYDILIVKDGKSFSGDGKSIEQYFCWGEPVLAPGSGTIVTAISSLPDNDPGVMDAANPPGNHVIIDMGNDEFALLAHLQEGSVLVEPGDEVSAGDTLGLCGNSGNTSEPHIHFHIQDRPGFGNGNGKPAFFENYLSNDILVDRGEPVRGESVRNAK
jgi:murein DD-endopeptidase MepM/ murein hydrolase activator NlpD